MSEPTDLTVVPDPESAAEPAVTAETPPPNDEEYTLLADGRILLAFEGKRFVLRRPRLGEYRHLRTLFLEVGKITGEEQIDHVIKWIDECFATLCDRPMSVPVDDWPTWLVAGMSFGDWITHWRDIPLAHGGQGGQ